MEIVGCLNFIGDWITFDRSIEDAVGCCGCVGAMRQICAAGMLQAGRPAQSNVLSFDLYNKIKTKQKNTTLIKLFNKENN